jgi:cytoskeletal protein RodZ
LIVSLCCAKIQRHFYGSDGVLDLLKKTREEKNLSLEDVSGAIKVRRCYLEAIERNDYDNLPELVYSIGFARSYAKFLGLDDKEIANEMRSAILHKDTPDSNSRGSGDVSTSLSSDCSSLFSNLQDVSLLRLAYIVLIIAVVAVLIDLLTDLIGLRIW